MDRIELKRAAFAKIAGPEPKPVNIEELEQKERELRAKEFEEAKQAMSGRLSMFERNLAQHRAERTSRGWGF